MYRFVDRTQAAAELAKALTLYEQTVGDDGPTGVYALTIDNTGQMLTENT